MVKRKLRRLNLNLNLNLKRETKTNLGHVIRNVSAVGHVGMFVESSVCDGVTEACYENLDMHVQIFVTSF